ncbi:T9SS type A sorting domain-containing protein, partial [candidate division WOR-3 bacterium]|nr:T9SS type A sorting domain-containing protein [candidate division WOR-3 bacterium]
PYPYWSMLTPKNGMYGAIHFDSLRLNNVNYVAQYFDGYQYLVFPGSWDGWIEAIMAFWVQVADPGLGSVTFPAQLFTPWTPPIKSTPMIADYSLPAICMSSNSEGDRENNSQVTWDWQLKLSLKSGDLVDEYNYVGMSDDWRALSVVEFIVPLDEYVMLYIPQGDAGFKHLKLENFEGTMNIPVEIELNTNNETVELSWEFEGDVSGYEFIITDESGNELKMADRSSYDIVNTSRKVADTDIEAILTNPVLLLNRKVPGEIRRFNVAVKKICTGIEGVDFTGIELISPNPFTTGTTIKFALIDVMDVSLLVYDASGRLVKRLVDEKLGAGHYSYRWDGRDEIGVRLPSGIYFYKMNAEEYEKMGKLVLLR